LGADAFRIVENEIRLDMNDTSLAQKDLKGDATP